MANYGQLGPLLKVYDPGYILSDTRDHLWSFRAQAQASNMYFKGRVHFQRPICDIFLTLKCCSFIKKLIGIQKM